LRVTNPRSITIVTLSEQAFSELSLDDRAAPYARAGQPEKERYSDLSLPARERRMRDDHSSAQMSTDLMMLSYRIRTAELERANRALALGRPAPQVLEQLAHGVAASFLHGSMQILNRVGVSRAGPLGESSPDRLDDIRLRRVLDYIAANVGDDITLANLARVAGYSPFHFARKFSFAMGMPPHRYISRVRLGNAMVELAAGKLPLAEIALNAHFSSQASFTRAFHRATGMTPREYRRRRL
jgi:AraC-like DNA-binding protein